MAVIWHQLFKISDVLFIDDYLAVCHTEGVDRITKKQRKRCQTLGKWNKRIYKNIS